jgi:intracellular sulfur oxidation DsrE/DsrF family protein
MLNRLFLSLVLSLSILLAQESSIKVVYDLTTKNLKTFEKKILKAIVVNKTHYEGRLKELDVSVVIHKDAYRFFIKEPLKSIYKDDKELLANYKSLSKRIESLSSIYEVEFLICGSGIEGRGIKQSDIYNFVNITPNANIALIDRQNSGYAYLPVGD